MAKKHHLSTITLVGLCLLFQYLPILVMVVFSFNSAKSLSNFKGFSIYWYQELFKNNEDGRIIGAYTLTENLRTILPYKPTVEFHNSDIVKNDDIAFWNISFVVINGDENDPNSYQVGGQLDYNDFIKKLPKDKYEFIDASYIMVEPLSKEEISDLLK